MLLIYTLILFVLLNSSDSITSSTDLSLSELKGVESGGDTYPPGCEHASRENDIDPCPSTITVPDIKGKVPATTASTTSLVEPKKSATKGTTAT